MARRPEVGPPEGQQEVAAVRAILGNELATPDAEALARLDSVGPESLRVVRDDRSRPVGAVTVLPMAQYFGGRHVAVAGLAGLGVLPEEGPRGATFKLLKHSLGELRAEGFAAALVHPRRQAIFRTVGFEQAGARYEVRVAAEHIEVGDRELDVRRIQSSDTAAVVEAYQRHAMSHNGHLVRHPYQWHRIQHPEPGPVHAYLVAGRKGIEGYCYMHQRPRPGARGYDLHVTDVASLTARAGRRMLTLWADHQSKAGTVVWNGHPNDSLCALLPERTFQVSIDNYWMLRILDVAGALKQRGFPRGVAAELHLWVRDVIFPDNTLSLILRVLDGRGTLEPGGRGTLRMDIGGLSALYTGHRSPATLRAAGLLEGPDDDVELATTIFGGSDSWHPDHL